MQIKSVNSSAISAVGYDPQSGIMSITFKQGKTYDFCGVPQHIYDGLISAGSVGSYYNSNIRDRYQC